MNTVGQHRLVDELHDYMQCNNISQTQMAATLSVSPSQFCGWYTKKGTNTGIALKAKKFLQQHDIAQPKAAQPQRRKNAAYWKRFYAANQRLRLAQISEDAFLANPERYTQVILCDQIVK